MSEVYGYAIRIVSDNHQNFYSTFDNLLQKYIVGVDLKDAKFFLDRDNADQMKRHIENWLERTSKVHSKTFREIAVENDNGFKGFEIVDVQFSEVYYTLSVNLFDESGVPQTPLGIRDMFFDNDTNQCVISLTASEHIGPERFYSRDDANMRIEMAKMSNHSLAKFMTIKNNFLNPSLCDE